MLKGSLNDFTLADVIRMAARAERTGCFTVRRREGDGRVFLRAGALYHAESSHERETVEDRLVRLGLTTSERLRKARVSAGLGRPQVLVAAGVPREEVEEAARAVLKNALFDLVRWRDGEFSWEADAGIEVDFSVTLSADAALDECVDRLRRAEMFLTAMPSPDQVVALSPRPPHTSHDVKVPAEGWRALVQVDGRRSVREVIAAIGGDEMDARAVLYGLYEAGLIEVRAPVVEPAKLRAVKDEELAEAVGQAGSMLRPIEDKPAAGRGQEPPRQEPPRQEPAPQSRSPQPQAQAAPPVPPSAPEAAPSAQVRAPGGGPAAKEEPALDRAQLVRELAGLLNDDAPSHPRAGSKRRVEEDRSINKGQVSRLIDGVKRLD